MVTRICVSITAYKHPIIMRQDDKGLFNVQYGDQLFDSLSHTRAMVVLGGCIMHAAVEQGAIKTVDGIGKFDMVRWDLVA